MFWTNGWCSMAKIPTLEALDDLRALALSRRQASANAV